MAGKTPIRYVPYTVTTAAFTPTTAPLSTPLNLDVVMLVSAQIMIPPGHSGLTGIRLDTSGGTILPFSNPPSWIFGDGRDIMFDLDVQADSQMKWVTFNNDVGPHSHYILLKVIDIAARPVSGLSTSLVGLEG